MNNQAIEKRIQELSPEYRSFIESDFTEMTAKIFAEKLGLEGRQIEVLENGLLLYLLFFFSRDQFAGFITTECGVPSKTSSMVATAINSGLPDIVAAGLDEAEILMNENKSVINQSSIAESADVKADVDSKALPQTTAPEPVKVADVPASPVDQVTTIAPVRTMESDVDKIHGYGAYRKLYPEQTGGDQTEAGVIKATSQDEVLAKRPKLSDTPTYKAEDGKS